ncbi:Na+/H+ antiporter NhaC [Parendozoicomonas haliclonae]|uniref:Malate-2H(+)/Na(+)-lactate antiporter n=1 Tax=Parendozoicomonas haliclonae TaxID=1960125 RepID=A0A1X7AMW5_9GAMM|nr:Na+/H+ antiporter NhaC [Parendozoicomonas haliclonae]SMA49385.1 Malate-2H(+)/Na(+)-lactate antiporter [Parendozoicomonas haliclonae]
MSQAMHHPDSSPDQPSREPTFNQALITFSAIVAIIGIGLFYLSTSLHSLMLGCLIVAGSSVLYLGYDYKAVREAMNEGIRGALTAIYIFIMIGVLIAALIESGTLASLIYLGVQFIEPAIFLPAGLVLCSLMSVATGTSWGTVGTAGVILMGIGSAMNFPPELVAGMVISGACFGDKMSPVSDTTNLAAMSSGTPLYQHMRSMCYTTVPVYILVLVLFTWLGLDYSNEPMPASELAVLNTALTETFNISWLAIIPLLVMLMLSAFRAPAEVAMMASAASCILLAVTLQERAFGAVLNSLFSGSDIRSGVEVLDGLLGRGGISSMMWTLSLALMALALGGILNHFGFLRVLISGILKRVKRSASLVATTIVSCFVGNGSMGEAYMTLILGGQLFGDAYDKQGLDRSVLSRSLEEGATLTVALIPWTTGGAFFASTLGVPVLEYAPWALLNWLNPLVAIAFAYLGIGLFKAGVAAEQPALDRARKAA